MAEPKRERKAGGRHKMHSRKAPKQGNGRSGQEEVDTLEGLQSPLLHLRPWIGCNARRMALGVAAPLHHPHSHRIRPRIVVLVAFPEVRAVVGLRELHLCPL